MLVTVEQSFRFSHNSISKEVGKEHNWDSWHKLMQEILCQVTYSAKKATRKKERVHVGLSSFSSQVLRVMEPCSPGEDWTLPCPWEMMNEFLALPSLGTQLLLSLLNYLFVNLWLDVFSPFWFAQPCSWVRYDSLMQLPHKKCIFYCH